MKWADIDKISFDQAYYVFRLRVFYGYSWRAVAHACCEHWNGDWDENQMAGIDLCEAAAKKLFGSSSHYMDEIWNG